MGMHSNGTPGMPQTLPTDPTLTLVQHGGQLHLTSNLQGPQALQILRQMLLQAADMVLIEQVKADVQGQALIQVPRLQVIPGMG